MKYNFSEYIEHACDHVINQIQNCFLNLMVGQKLGPFQDHQKLKREITILTK